MKNRFRSLAVLLVIGLLVQPLLSARSAAADYLGEHCWRSVSTAQDVYTFKFAVEAIGQNHFRLTGYARYGEQAGGANGFEPTHGNAELYENQARMTLTRSGASPDGDNLWADTLYVVLDAASLTGTYKALYQEYIIPADAADTVYSRGTFTYVPCP